MRSFSRVACVLLSGVVTLAVLGGPALAQTSIEVPQGSAFTVENGDECAANADVVISFTSPTREPTRIGSSVSDGSGHFSTQVTLPSTAVLGPATVLVDCGIGESVLLYDVAVVASTNTDLLSYAPYVIGGVLVLLGIMVLIGRRGSRDDVEVEPPDQSAAPVAEVAVPADDENDPDYWFWDAMTERGPVKRLACLTDTTFFLHEAPAEAFSALLEHLAVVGPDVALERAFFKVAVADIDEIRHRSTEIRINHRTAEGFVARTIDLATEVDGVIGLLSRRVPITADNPPPVGSM